MVGRPGEDPGLAEEIMYPLWPGNTVSGNCQWGEGGLIFSPGSVAFTTRLRMSSRS